MTDPTFTTETITPEMAADYLTRNVENRPLRARRVHSIARDITRDAWQMTGDPIRFDEEGALQDGQHRLAACVEANIPIRSIVMRNSPVAVRRVIDSGDRRTAGDVLQMEGYPSAHALAATARIALLKDAGSLTNTLSSGSPAFTHDDILTWVQDNQEMLVDAVHIAARHRIRGTKEAASAYVALELLKVATAEEVDEFFDATNTNRTNGKGDPRFALKEFFADRKEKRLPVSVAETVFVYLKTWNALRRGERLSFFRFVSPVTEKGGKKVGLPIPAPIA